MTLETYKKTFETFQKTQTNAPAWLLESQNKAFQNFITEGWPTKKQERWKYTSLKPLAEQDFTLPSAENPSAAIPNFGNGCHLVFVNGIFNAKQSNDLPAGVTLNTTASTSSFAVLDFEKAFEKFHKDSLLDLNQAFANSGAHLEVAKNTVVKDPIHLIFVFDHNEKAQAAFFPRNRILLNQGAELTITETYHSQNDSCFYHAMTDVVLEDNAKISHDVVQADAQNSFAMQTTRAIAKRNANYKNTHFTLGSQITRHNLEVALQNEGARSELYALYPVKPNAHVDHNTWVHHAAPHTETEQLYKSIVKDGGHGIFNGMIQVYQPAQKTNAVQMNKNLLLGEKAEVDTKPQLLIHADDVKCAHGSTVGQMDDESLFYLNSRGIPKDQAYQMLIEGFAVDVVQHVTNKPLQNWILEKMADEFLHP